MRWRLFNCQTAAFDREIIKCTSTIVCCQNCIWCRCYQMHWQNCLLLDCCIWSFHDQMHVDNCLLSKLYLMSMSLNALTKLFNCQIVAFNFERSNARWQLSVAKIRGSNVFRDETLKIAFNVEIVECINDFICFIAYYRIVKRTNC